MDVEKNLLERISVRYPQLPEAAQEVANYIQAQPMAMASLSVSEIASETGTSKATVSRFFRQLGYASHQDAKKALLKKRELGFPALPIEQSQDDIQQELLQIERTLTAISNETLDHIASTLASAPRIVLIGYRSSFPLAMNFCRQLKQVRNQVVLVPQSAQTIAEDLVDLKKDDVIVLVGLRRRPRIFTKLIEHLTGKRTLLLTDPSGQIYNQSVTHLLVCHLGDNQPLDSYAAPMSVISVLCNRVYKLLGEQGQQRASDIADLYEDLGELS
jgi:DNA-binding MurR/RpiR family transcriptional regulator